MVTIGEYGVQYNFNNIIMIFHQGTFPLAYTITKEDCGSGHNFKASPGRGKKCSCILPVWKENMMEVEECSVGACFDLQQHCFLLNV